ncbi:CCA tRNA nucleotidyltransferase [Cyanobium sp. ATX-6F1]|uniref:CCA tRNA nucleotidyltransferase n=1 Tax=Cyanobium sp. ATX-6F1 TaxID=3137388 RepID=UPI0039BE3427
MELPGLPPGLLEALVAHSGGRRLALVGGAVRDLLLHQVHNDPWRGLVDLDLVLEGSAPELAERLRVWAGPERLGFCHIHGAYGTAELELDGVLLDLASARQESYPAPGENPVVRFAALADDLARRDFTINAMALELAPAAGGVVALELLDPHGGQADLAARRLRLLHGSSLNDDPTRVLRAARYAARLGFELAPGSLEQLRRTLAAWPWAWRPGDPPELAPPALGTRLRMELDLLLEREDWREALGCLQAWGPCPWWRRPSRTTATGGAGCAGPSASRYPCCRPGWRWWLIFRRWRPGCSCPTTARSCCTSSFSCASGWRRCRAPAPAGRPRAGARRWKSGVGRRRRWPWPWRRASAPVGPCCAGGCAGVT